MSTVLKPFIKAFSFDEKIIVSLVITGTSYLQLKDQEDWGLFFFFKSNNNPKKTEEIQHFPVK